MNVISCMNMEVFWYVIWILFHIIYHTYFISYDEADKIPLPITKGDILELNSFVGPEIWDTWDKTAMGRYSLDLGNVNQSCTILSAQCSTTF